MDNDRIEERLQAIECQLSVISEKLGTANYTGLSSLSVAVEAIRWLGAGSDEKRDCDWEELFTIAEYVGSKWRDWGYSFSNAREALYEAAKGAGFVDDELEFNIVLALDRGSVDYDRRIEKEIDRFHSHTGYTAKADWVIAEKYTWEEVKKLSNIDEVIDYILGLNMGRYYSNRYLMIAASHLGNNVVTWGEDCEYARDKLVQAARTNNSTFGTPIDRDTINDMLRHFGLAYVGAEIERESWSKGE